MPNKPELLEGEPQEARASEWQYLQLTPAQAVSGTSHIFSDNRPGLAEYVGHILHLWRQGASLASEPSCACFSRPWVTLKLRPSVTIDYVQFTMLNKSSGTNHVC